LGWPAANELLVVLPGACHEPSGPMEPLLGKGPIGLGGLWADG